MMKKILGAFVAVALMFTMTACGGSDSSEEQEKVVNNFFSYMEKGDLKSMKKIMTANGYTDVKAIETAFNAGTAEFSDSTKYGETTIKEAQGYIDHIFAKLFKDVKIKEAEVDGDETIVKITGKQIQTGDFSSKVKGIDYEKMMTDFTNVKENEEKMMQVLNEKGQEEAVKWLVDQVAPQLFDELEKKIDECGYESYEGSFRLVKEDGKWLIDSIS